ncbi:hypothetical protein ACTG9Q_31840 [Actinokineospora sp. 24-640]
MTRLAITWLTFLALAVALVMGVLWFTTSPTGDRLEPAVNSLAVLAGITGIFVERWAAQRERRNQALESIREELERNAAVLDDDAFATTAGAHRRLYPPADPLHGRRRVQHRRARRARRRRPRRAAAPLARLRRVGEPAPRADRDAAVHHVVQRRDRAVQPGAARPGQRPARCP